MRPRPAHAVVAIALVVATACSLEPIDLDASIPLALRTTITAADGSLLARVFKANANRVLVPLRRVPVSLQHAVLAAEDARFYQHPGYDLRSIARAALVNLREGEVVEGGSTITQQYVKNAFFRDPERTFVRKARELRLAIEIEKRYTKRQILSRYLNTVYMGEGAYGVQAGAESYFHKHVTALTLPESATLAAVIRAPALYDPRLHPARARSRRDYILGRMATLDMVPERAATKAIKKPLGVAKQPPPDSVRDPYFVEAVKREVLRERRLGLSDTERANALYRGGLTVRTTLRPRLQEAAERAVDQVLNQKGDPAAALVSIEPRTGRIVAMVGGRDWSASQVNLALGRAGGGSGRQSGSAFKPIDAATAMENGISLDETYPSSPAVFHLADGSTWSVGNAEGGGYGRLSLYEALVHSVNGVYARLALDIGPEQIATQAHLMGVTAHLPNYPSIALGSAEVSVLDMATAYSSIANGGTYVSPTTIRSIETADGNVIRPEQDVQPGVLAPGNAYLLTKAMEDVIRRGTGTAAAIGRPAAGKTGTTNDHGDAWFVGYTPDLVTAVWVGYPNGVIPMTNVHGITVFGGTFPALIWRNFMLAALKNTPPHDFKLPKSDLVTVRIDPVSGLLVAPWCEPGVKRRMLRQFVPTTTCPQPPIVTPSPSPSEDKGKKPRG
ncbi:MAG TPA: PBP1A family penicillin-binding protein, partial [Actinomycetota bacterium]|nr:PBP1A family penicillin-binding protein [Actinomycetota bacterium]